MAVSVPLRVDGLVGGDVDDLSLDLLLIGLLRLDDRGRGRGDSGSGDLVFGLVAVLRGSDSAGGGLRSGGRSLLGSGRSSGGRRLALLLVARSLSTAHVEIHVLVGLASLGLDVMGKDVGHLVAGRGIVARQDRAPGVGGGGLDRTSLVTNTQVVTLLPGGAVALVVRAVNVGDIKVVEVEAGGVLLDEVLELGDVVALALLGLGNLDRDTDVPTLRILVVLLVDLALLQGDHLVARAAVALVDRPQVNIVVAAVVDAGQGLAGIDLLVEGDCAPGGGSSDHGGRDRKDSDELHFSWYDRILRNDSIRLVKMSNERVTAEHLKE